MDRDTLQSMQKESKLLFFCLCGNEIIDISSMRTPTASLSLYLPIYTAC